MSPGWIFGASKIDLTPAPNSDVYYWPFGGGGSYVVLSIMKTRLFKYIENFTTKNEKKKKKNQIKNPDILNVCSKHRL